MPVRRVDEDETFSDDSGLDRPLELLALPERFPVLEPERVHPFRGRESHAAGCADEDGAALPG